MVGSGTASSDLCAKGTPGAKLCQRVLEQTVGRLGGIHAFRLVRPGELPDLPDLGFPGRPRLSDVSGLPGTDRSNGPDRPRRGGGEGVLVFNAASNRLRAYDPATGAEHTVIPSRADAPVRGRDVNGQICFDPDRPRYFVAGEDTGQPERPPGWGYFRLTGSRLEKLGAVQVGNLVPTYQPGVDNPGNYGCGFLSDGRLVTTDVGNQRPGRPGSGQLIVWFPPFDDRDVAYCKVGVHIATAGGVYVDDRDRVYVASARPGLDGDGTPAGVYRYTDLPPGPTAAGGCGRRDATGAPLATEVHRELFIPADPHVPTPSAIVRSPRGGFYVSSVFNGVIAEYGPTGDFVREVLRPPLGDLLPPYSTGTPFGLGVALDGTLFYADIGLTLGPPPGPGEHRGSVRGISFRAGEPQPPQTLEDGLTFPDGIGILPKTVLRNGATGEAP